MDKKWNLAVALLGGALLFAGTAQAAHPLITDDAGTVGAGHYQVEINGKYDHTDDQGVTREKEEGGVVLTYGAAEALDLVVTLLPYTAWSTRDDTAGKTSERGIGDTSLEAKWRFYEQEGTSLALKPGITLPTGNDDKNLGAGKATYRLFFIGTQQLEPWAFHLNLGYIRNNNAKDERENLWHASVAGEVELTKGLRLVANLGAERAPDKGANTDPAFLLGGVIYSVTEQCDLDIGIKGGLNHAEPDYTLLAGITLKY